MVRIRVHVFALVSLVVAAGCHLHRPAEHPAGDVDPRDGTAGAPSERSDGGDGTPPNAPEPIIKPEPTDLKL
jgi:hypothetical protein